MNAAALLAFTQTLVVGRSVTVEWTSAQHPQRAIWKGSVVSRKDDGTSVTISYTEPANAGVHIFPPIHAVTILAARSDVAADPWADAMRLQRAGITSTTAASFLDPSSWAMFVDVDLPLRPQALLMFSNWMRGHHSVIESARSTRGKPETHRKNTLVRGLERWVAMCQENPGWRTPRVLAVAEELVFDLESIYIVTQGGCSRTFAIHADAGKPLTEAYNLALLKKGSE